MKKDKELRTFGNELVGSIPWGTHLCQFYETKQDLIDILVPYFAEGLRSNEFCMWITSQPLEVKEATEALKEAVPDLDEYIRKRQIEIISYNDWYLIGGKFDSNRVLQGWVKKEKAALKRGFEGLRLTGNTFWIERDLWKSFVDYEEAVNAVIGQHRMLAVCTYCLTNCTGTDVLDVVRNHVGTLIRKEKVWHLVEDMMQRKETEAALVESESRYRSLFANMNSGFAYHKIILNDNGKPVDYVFLDVNDDFAKLTGLKREEILGKRVTEMLPGIEKDPVDWIGIYGKVSLTGEPVRFENYSQNLKKWYSLSAYSPAKGFFAAAFDDITKRKQAEFALRASEQRWATTLASIGDAVIATDLDGKVTFMNAVAEELTGWTLNEASQKPVIEVFNIINEQTCLQVEDPVVRVLEKGVVVGLANHTILVRKDGTEVPIDDSGAPIKSEDGKVVGVVLVFRDITERRLAEEEIKRLNAFQKRVFESISDELMVIDLRNFTVLMANNVLLNDVGMEEKEVIGRQCFAVTHHNSERCSPPACTCPVTEMLRTGESVIVEHTHFNGEGNPYYVEVSASPITDQEGNIVQAVHLARDVTERKKAEKALKDSQHDLNHAQAVGKSGSWRLDVRRNELLWSDETHKMFGIPKGTPLTYETFLDTVHPDDRQYVDQRWKAALEGAPYDIEHRIVIDGAVKWVREKAELEFDNKGLLLGGFGTVQDITEHKRMEHELFDTLEAAQRRQSEVSALLRASKTVLQHRDFLKSARLIFDSCKELLGATAGYVALLNEETMRNEVLFLDSGGLRCTVVPSLPMPIRGLRADAYKTGKAVYHNDFSSSEWAKLMPEWHMTLKNVLFAPLTIDKKTVGLMGIANKHGGFTKHDAKMALAFGELASIALINSRMLDSLEDKEKRLKAYAEHLEELVEEKTRRLRDAERLAAIGETAGMVGHDIRNPLQSMDGAIYLAKEGLQSLSCESHEKTELREILDIIENQTHYIDHIVADLQDFAKKAVPQTETTYIRDSINKSLSMTKIPDNIQVNVVLPEDPVAFAFDPSYMKRVFVNLINNAVQAMPNGGELTIFVFQKDDGVWIRFEDTGVGIPEEVKPHLFSPLFTTKSKGQGFGLAVCKKLIEAQNGEISCQSQEGKGITFTIKLPIKQGAEYLWSKKASS